MSTNGIPKGSRSEPELVDNLEQAGAGIVCLTPDSLDARWVLFEAGGKAVDKRTDIWAFGCVLYEMLTGRRASDAEDMMEVLGAVVRLDPNWEALSSDVPQPVRTLLQRCLVKDRRKRIADIAAALFVLDHEAGVAASSTASAALLPRGPLWRRLAALTAGALVAAVFGGALVWFATRPAPPRVVRTTITTSESAALTLSGGDRDVAITPDGSRLVYRGTTSCRCVR